jgi:FlaA1/EpsC-like NDP-sugar epimerase
VDLFVIIRTINKLVFLPRFIKTGIMIIFDSVAVIISLILAFSLRFGYFFFPEIYSSEGDFNEFFLLIVLAPLISLPIFYNFGLYRSIIRYIGLNSISVVVQAVSLYAVLWGLLTYMVDIKDIPRSAIIINWIISIIVIGGGRIFARWLLVKDHNIRKKTVIIYGAGSAGLQLSNSLHASETYQNIGYIDDNKSLQGSYINGVKVFSVNEISHLIKKYNVNDLFLALPSLSKRQLNKIIDRLMQYRIHVRSLPSVSDLASGRVKIDDLKDINIADLLGRKSIKPNNNLLKEKIHNKVVLVTGAGGSIGSELCRQILFLKPKKLILFDVSESSLYQIDRELNYKDEQKIKIIPVLGSVRELDILKNIFKNYCVQTIYHAAAYKHVPLVEYNPSQGVLNNSIGTLSAVMAAIDADVETFVLISTDKAVRPTNTMGASKRVAELVLQALATQNHNTSLTMVRFGNVLDSSGSVIPLFKKQIKEGGPLTVTQSNIIRYFMTIPEAVELVIQAGAMGKGGEVFVLDMGKPIRIYDLAKKMISLSGLKILDDDNPDGDIEIVFTGLRPGEKLYEELLVGNNVSKTENELIMKAIEEMINWDELKPLLDELNEAAKNSEELRVRNLLLKIVPGFKPNL